MKTLKRFKKTSDAQDRIENFPDLFAEFRALERALCACGNDIMIEPQYVRDAERRLNDLDKFFGFEQESQFRKTGIESSQWADRRS